MTTGLGTGEEELPLVLVARDIPDLRSLVDEVVEARWGMPPEWVSADQAAMRFPSALVALTLHDGPLMIEVAAELVSSDASSSRVLEVVNRLNAGLPPYSFVLAEGGDIEVRTYVPSVPFVPDHLYVALSLATEAVAELAPRVIEMLAADA